MINLIGYLLEFSEVLYVKCFEQGLAHTEPHMRIRYSHHHYLFILVLCSRLSTLLAWRLQDQ